MAYLDRRRSTAAVSIKPTSCQARTCRQVSPKTQAPKGTIRPHASATGMNSPGGTSPRVGCRQRTSASTPSSRPSPVRPAAGSGARIRRHRARGAAPARVGAGASPGVHGRLEEAKSATAFMLGAVQCQVGAAHQLVRVGTAIGVDGNPMLAATLMPWLSTVNGAATPRPAARPNGSVAGLKRVGLQDGEFISAEPGQRVADAHDPSEPFRRRLQQLIAGGVPQSVVDLLESVQVEQEQRNTRTCPLGVRQSLPEAVAQQVAIGHQLARRDAPGLGGGDVDNSYGQRFHRLRSHPRDDTWPGPHFAGLDSPVRRSGGEWLHFSQG